VQGGGRSSARETIGRVAAGAVAKKILKLQSGTEVLAYVSRVHGVELPEDMVDHETLKFPKYNINCDVFVQSDTILGGIIYIDWLGQIYIVLFVWSTFPTH
jgi:chorismate synthase